MARAAPPPITQNYLALPEIARALRFLTPATRYCRPLSPLLYDTHRLRDQLAAVRRDIGARADRRQSGPVVLRTASRRTRAGHHDRVLSLLLDRSAQVHHRRRPPRAVPAQMATGARPATSPSSSSTPPLRPAAYAAPQLASAARQQHVVSPSTRFISSTGRTEWFARISRSTRLRHPGPRGRDLRVGRCRDEGRHHRRAEPHCPVPGRDLMHHDREVSHAPIAT